MLDDDDVWACGCLKAASAPLRADPRHAQGKPCLCGVYGVGWVMTKGSSTEWNRSRRSSLRHGQVIDVCRSLLFSPSTSLLCRLELSPNPRHVLIFDPQRTSLCILFVQYRHGRVY